MNFDWTPEQQAYRRRLQKFLQDALPPDWDAIRSRGVASGAQIDYSKTFCAQMADAGLLVHHWPKEYGGGDGTNALAIADQAWPRTVSAK